jgi:3-deoxy-D-manno-octulosonate 8-phosphate phosphatase (KDO 8-P phosphatase)
MPHNIKLLVMDVDGVMTGGTISYLPNGEEIKHFNVRDGYGIKQLHEAGIKTAIITGRDSTAVSHRAKDLNIHKVFMGIQDKLSTLKALTKEMDIPFEQVAYVGDDLPDLEAMQAVGFPITVKNGDIKLKEMASWITEKKGGDGAVREVCDWILENA